MPVRARVRSLLKYTSPRENISLNPSNLGSAGAGAGAGRGTVGGTAAPSGRNPGSILAALKADSSSRVMKKYGFEIFSNRSSVAGLSFLALNSPSTSFHLLG